MSTLGFTYNVIIKRLEDFCHAHPLIARFTYGQISDADIEKNSVYPWLHVVPSSMSLDNGQIIYTLDVTVADIASEKTDKNGHSKEIISDSFLIFQDLVAMIDNGLLFGDNIVTNYPITCNPFMEEFSNDLAGVEGSIDLVIDFDANACQIPLMIE